MLRRDYILRWTQELAKVMARLLGKDLHAALPVIDEAYQAVLQTDPVTLRTVPPEQLLPFLQQEKGLNSGQLEFVAGLLAREGELLYESGDLVQSRDRLHRALLIFEHVEHTHEVFSFERQDRIAAVRKRIAETGEGRTDSCQHR